MESHAGWRGSGRDARCTSAEGTASHVMCDGIQALTDIDGFCQIFDVGNLARSPVKKLFKQFTPMRISECDDRGIVTAERITDAGRYFRNHFWHVEDCGVFTTKGDEADGLLIQI